MDETYWSQKLILEGFHQESLVCEGLYQVQHVLPESGLRGRRHPLVGEQARVDNPQAEGSICCMDGGATQVAACFTIIT